MKKSTELKLAEIITFLNVPFSVFPDSYVLCCNEEQYVKLTKALLFYCYDFKVTTSEPIDSRFDVIYIEIEKDSILRNPYK